MSPLQVLATFWNWIDVRRERQLSVSIDRSARLSLRKFEERQVLSVAAAVVHGVLDIHVTDSNQTLNVSTDGSGHVVIDGTVNGTQDAHLVLDESSFSSIQITSDASAGQIVSFEGTQPLQVSGSITVDAGFSQINVDTGIQAAGINLAATDIAISASGGQEPSADCALKRTSTICGKICAQ